MSDEPVPMLNKPLEGKSETAEQFAELNQTLYAPTKADQERIERFREEASNALKR